MAKAAEEPEVKESLDLETIMAAVTIDDISDGEERRGKTAGKAKKASESSTTTTRARAGTVKCPKCSSEYHDLASTELVVECEQCGERLAVDCNIYVSASDAGGGGGSSSGRPTRKSTRRGRGAGSKSSSSSSSGSSSSSTREESKKEWEVRSVRLYVGSAVDYFHPKWASGTVLQIGYIKSIASDGTAAIVEHTDFRRTTIYDIAVPVQDLKPVGLALSNRRRVRTRTPLFGEDRVETEPEQAINMVQSASAADIIRSGKFTKRSCDNTGSSSGGASSGGARNSSSSNSSSSSRRAQVASRSKGSGKKTQRNSNNKCAAKKKNQARINGRFYKVKEEEEEEEEEDEEEEVVEEEVVEEEEENDQYGITPAGEGTKEPHARAKGKKSDTRKSTNNEKEPQEGEGEGKGEWARKKEKMKQAWRSRKAKQRARATVASAEDEERQQEEGEGRPLIHHLFDIDAPPPEMEDAADGRRDSKKRKRKSGSGADVRYDKERKEGKKEKKLKASITAGLVKVKVKGAGRSGMEAKESKKIRKSKRQKDKQKCSSRSSKVKGGKTNGQTKNKTKSKSSRGHHKSSGSSSSSRKRKYAKALKKEPGWEEDEEDEEEVEATEPHQLQEVPIQFFAEFLHPRFSMDHFRTVPNVVDLAARALQDCRRWPRRALQEQHAKEEEEEEGSEAGGADLSALDGNGGGGDSMDELTTEDDSSSQGQSQQLWQPRAVEGGRWDGHQPAPMRQSSSGSSGSSGSTTGSSRSSSEEGAAFSALDLLCDQRVPRDDSGGGRSSGAGGLGGVDGADRADGASGLEGNGSRSWDGYSAKGSAGALVPASVSAPLGAANSGTLTFADFGVVLEATYEVHGGRKVIESRPGIKGCMRDQGEDLMYGSVLPDAVDQICRWMGVGRDSVFLDIGSGIGNVVFQVAAVAGCKARGVELGETRYKMSQSLSSTFSKQLRIFDPSVKLDLELSLGCLTQLPVSVWKETDQVFFNNAEGYFDGHRHVQKGITSVIVRLMTQYCKGGTKLMCLWMIEKPLSWSNPVEYETEKNAVSWGGSEKSVKVYIYTLPAPEDRKWKCLWCHYEQDDRTDGICSVCDKAAGVQGRTRSMQASAPSPPPGAHASAPPPPPAAAAAAPTLSARPASTSSSLSSSSSSPPSSSSAEVTLASGAQTSPIVTVPPAAAAAVPPIAANVPPTAGRAGPGTSPLETLGW